MGHSPIIGPFFNVGNNVNTTTPGYLYAQNKISVGGFLPSTPDGVIESLFINNSSFRLADPNLVHPFTSIINQNRFMFLGQLNRPFSLGGANLDGFSSGNNTAMRISGYIGNSAPTEPAMTFFANKFNAGVVALTGNEIAFLFTSNALNIPTLTIYGNRSSQFDGKIGIKNNPTAELDISQTAYTGISPIGIRFTGGAHTSCVASVEVFDIFINLNRNVQFSVGPIAMQRAMVFNAPTYSFTAASTLSDAVGFEISNGPLPGTNATFTRSTAFRIGSANWRLGSVSPIAINAGAHIIPPGISNGIGQQNIAASLAIYSITASIDLGDQVATTDKLAGYYVDSITYSASAGTRTINNPASIFVQGAPIAGANVTFTNGPYSLFINAGTSRFNGRVLQAKGADVPSGTTITLGNGNCFDVTGVTTIQNMTVTGWTDGSIVNLHFDSALTVTHNGLVSPNTAVFQLAGAANFAATAGDNLTVQLKEGSWRELSRTVI